METRQELSLPRRAPGRGLPAILPHLPVRWPCHLTSFSGLLGFSLVLGMILVAIFGPTLAPATAWKTVSIPFQPPSLANPLGTDDLGRDLLSGIIYAVRTSLLVGVSAAALSTGFGLFLGLFSGYKGGLIDDLSMRLAEFFQVIPRFFLALLAVAFFKPGLVTITLVLGLTSWPMTARIVRAQTLSVREREYVTAARALGAGDLFIVRQHILPNTINPVIVHASLLVGQIMLVEAGLAFLGLGDPTHISLGYLLRNAQPFLRLAWWMFLFPGVAIGLAVVGFNLVGDSINDQFSVKREA